MCIRDRAKPAHIDKILTQSLVKEPDMFHKTQSTTRPADKILMQSHMSQKTQVTRPPKPDIMGKKLTQSLTKGADMFQKTQITRPAKPAPKMLTGSNALPIGTRSGPRAEKGQYGVTTGQDIKGKNFSNALETQVDRSRKRVEFQEVTDKEREMNKAKQKMSISPKHHKLKPILKESENSQVGQFKDLSTVDENSSEKKNELAVKTNVEYKIESQKDKAKKERKDRSSGKSLEKRQDEVEQKKIGSEKNKRETNGKGKGKNNNNIQQKLHVKIKPKENVQNKKMIQIDSKDKVDKEIQEKPNQMGNGNAKTASKDEQKKKTSNHNEEEQQDCKINVKKVFKSKPEIKISSFNPSAASSASKVLKSQSPKVTPGKGNVKEKLHCPCPPYCPACLKKVKMN